MSKVIRRGTRDRGLATFIAVVMISIVAMGSLALTALFQTDARRTQHHTAETQLRELLIAGAIIADNAVHADPLITGEKTIDLSDTIGDAGLTILYTVAHRGEKRAAVTAHVGEARANETLTFRQTGAGWAPDRVSLDRLR